MLITEHFDKNADVTLYHGDVLDLLKEIPDKSANLVVTSPPYNIGKEYEKKIKIQEYLSNQEEVITGCVRILAENGSICWEVGNYIEKGEVYPLDTLLYPIFKKLGLQMRNRIIWYFEHGLHSSRRFSGRYETINWFTKSDNYYFNLDPVRVPQKYPGKLHYKGPKRGMPSGNPLGKNPSDVWIIPNVKHNHPEKTIHPCQFPIGLVERLVLSMTKEGDLVFDPYMGVGSTAIAAVKNKRKAAGADLIKKYFDVARERLKHLEQGTLPMRPMNKPIYQPNKNSKLVKYPFTT
jgi:adenine-specific DNA-methyltransferase